MISSFKKSTVKWAIAALILALTVGWGISAQAQPDSHLTNLSGQTATDNNLQIPEQIPALNSSAIDYSQAQLAQVQSTASKVGVKAFLPQAGTTGDQLTLVKNGGNSLILDYKNIWLVESADPLNLPPSIETASVAEISPSLSGQYITNSNGNNSFLYLQIENTYICIENLSVPLTEQQLSAIAATLQPVLGWQAIVYSQDQLKQIQNNANQLGIQAFLPQTGTTGDQLTIIKNDGNSLILDYKNIWIIESARPINLPISNNTEKEVEISPSLKGQYITTSYHGEFNSYLYFQKGNTYISIQNLLPGNPLSATQLSAISGSLQSLHS